MCIQKNDDNNHSGMKVKMIKNSNENYTSNKRIIFIRHGRTYMNEYLSRPGSRWGDAGFTDIGLPKDLYRDSPLSQKGIEQAKALCGRIAVGLNQKDSNDKSFNVANMSEIDLVVVSPLTRAFQTFEYGLLPHIINQQDNEESNSLTKKKNIPIIALPLASERVYLISDLGLPTEILKQKFPYADFSSEFTQFDKEWWFTVNGANPLEILKEDKPSHCFNSIDLSQYKEWRPNDEGQTYACLGEPDEQFNQRMIALYEWLANRRERNICVVSHWGVLEFLTGFEFENCEVRTIPFDQIQRHVKISSTQ